MDSIHRPIASYATPQSTATSQPGATSNLYNYLQSQRPTVPPPVPQKCVLPYAGVDLRKLSWEKVLEVMEKQAEVYKLYQINAACGYEWANQQNRDYIETFNAQFKLEMERTTDSKLLPSFITKCISANEFYNKKISTGLQPPAPPPPQMQLQTQPQPPKEQLNKENTPPRKRKRSEPVYKGTDELKLLLQKERRVSHLDPPVYRYPPPSSSLLNLGHRMAKSSISTIPVVAKFKIERYRDVNNCEFFDLTADTDTDEQKSQPESRTQAAAN